jgi:triosephosphate isomerase
VGVASAVAPAAADLGALAQALTIPVLAQHTDPHPAGAHTGHMIPEALLAAGVRGSLVNHSERSLAPEEVARVVARLNELGMVPLVCAKEDRHAADLAARVHPPYLAVEPPELIGGTVSVSRARPELIRTSVHAVRGVSPKTHVLCGAGVQDGQDVRKALELGAEGVLVASAVTKAKDPERVLEEMLLGFVRG